MIVCELEYNVMCVEWGEVIGNVYELFFWDFNYFRVGEFYVYYLFWESVVEGYFEMLI